ncbi:MAG: DUF87 domain-containing protein [Thermoplasmataceae archaeon]
MYRKDYGVLASYHQGTSADGLKIGVTPRGKDVIVSRESMQHHFLVIGKTGSGKSSFMSSLAGQILNSHLGAVILLDPHGGLSTSAAADFPDRSVIIGSDSKGAFTVSTGLRTILKDTKEEIDQVVGTLRDQFSRNLALSQGTWGPRLELVFTVLIREILKRKEVKSLADVVSYLVNPTKVRMMLRDIADSNIRDFLKMQMADWKNWNNYISSAINKLLPIATDSAIRGIVDPPSDCIDLRKVIEDMSLIIPEIWSIGSESSSVASSLLLSRLWMEARRQPLAKHIYIFIDEAQNFPEFLLDTILREGRKFGITLILATQFLPIESELWRKTVVGNVGNYVLFNLASSDAIHITSSVTRSNERANILDIIQTLPPFNALLWQTDMNGIHGPIRFKTIKPREGNGQTYADVRSTFLEKFGSKVGGTSYGQNQDTDLHSHLLDLCVSYFSARGLRCGNFGRINNLIPDSVLEIDETEYMVEVEVSDVANLGRIIGKIINYRGRRIIFVTLGELCHIVYRGILRACSGENPNQEEAHITLEMLPNITILGFESTIPYIYTPGRRMVPRKDYFLKGSFYLQVSGSGKPKWKGILLHHMISAGCYRMSSHEIRQTFSPSLSKLMLENGKDHVSLDDILQPGGTP